MELEKEKEKKVTSDEVWEQYLNFEPEPFEYDENADPLYQRYMKSYQKNAKAAAEDSFARATAASGGFGNSFAAVASQQAYSEQMDKADDIIPDLYDYAYSRHTAKQSDKKQQLYNTATYLEGEEQEAKAEEEKATLRGDAAYGLAYGLKAEGYTDEDIAAAVMAEGYAEGEATAAIGRLGATKLYGEGTDEPKDDKPGGVLPEDIQAGLNGILYTEDENGNPVLSYDGSQKKAQTAALKQAGYTDAEIEQIFTEAQYKMDQTVYDAVGELERMGEDPNSIKMTDIAESYSTYKRLHDTGAISEDAWKEFSGALGNSVLKTYTYAADHVADADPEALGIDKATWDEYADDPSAQKELIYNAAAEMVSEGVMAKGDFSTLIKSDIMDVVDNAKKEHEKSDYTYAAGGKLGGAVADAFSLALNYYEAGTLGDEELLEIALDISSSMGDAFYIQEDGGIRVREDSYDDTYGYNEYWEYNPARWGAERSVTLKKYAEIVGQYHSDNHAKSPEERYDYDVTQQSVEEYIKNSSRYRAKKGGAVM